MVLARASRGSCSTGVRKGTQTPGLLLSAHPKACVLVTSSGRYLLGVCRTDQAVDQAAKLRPAGSVGRAG